VMAAPGKTTIYQGGLKASARTGGSVMVAARSRLNRTIRSHEITPHLRINRRGEMSSERDWNQISEIVRKVRELGLSYKDGAKRYGLSPWFLYSSRETRLFRIRLSFLAASAQMSGGIEVLLPRNRVLSPPEFGAPGLALQGARSLRILADFPES
jgi:hypothetical protein